ncbi:hypothetical protein [Sorangium sp. So ce145]|uniref:hypothetical protein n=1 Tax=Sorangium sp. So ce145 TaxID=3133285 RepID=UPI003F602A9E
MAGTGNEGDRGDGGPAVAKLDVPRRLALGPDGRLRIAEQGGNRVRRSTPDGTIATVAGTGAPGYSGDGGPATLATSTSPFSIALGPRWATPASDPASNQTEQIELLIFRPHPPRRLRNPGGIADTRR